MYLCFLLFCCTGVNRFCMRMQSSFFFVWFLVDTISGNMKRTHAHFIRAFLHTRTRLTHPRTYSQKNEMVEEVCARVLLCILPGCVPTDITPSRIGR